MVALFYCLFAMVLPWTPRTTSRPPKPSLKMLRIRILKQTFSYLITVPEFSFRQLQLNKPMGLFPPHFIGWRGGPVIKITPQINWSRPRKFKDEYLKGFGCIKKVHHSTFSVLSNRRFSKK